MEIEEIEHSSVLEEILNELKETSEDKPITMGLLSISALEMMSQLMSGRLNKRGNQKRLDRYLTFNTKLNTEQREVLYLFRNALVHTGGRFASTPAGKEYRFVFGDREQLIYSRTKTFYEINIQLLRNLVFKSWEKSLLKIQKDTSTHERYLFVLKRLGQVPT